MKIKVLSLAILSIFLFSCEKKEEQKSEGGQTVVAQKSLGNFDKEKVAAEVKARLEADTDLAGQALKSMWAGNPASGVKEFSMKLDNYQPKEGGATADSVLTFQLKPGEGIRILERPTQLKFKIDISYSPELYQKGIVAQIDYKPEFTPELQQQFSASDWDVKFIQGALNKLSMRTNLLADKNQQNIIAIEPFDEKDQLFAGQLDPNTAFSFKGLTVERFYNEEDFKENFNVGQSKVEFKGFDLKERDMGFSINPFTASGEVNKEGNGSYKVDKILLSLTDKNNVVRNFTIGGVDVLMKGYKFDQELFSNLGKMEVVAKDIAVEAPETKGLLKLFDMNMQQDTSKDANKLANGNISLDYLINGEEIAQKFMWPLVVNKVNIAFDFQRFNYIALMDWFGQMSEQQQEALKDGKIPAELQDKGWQLAADALKNETAYDFKINADTNAGTVKADLKVKGRKGADLNGFKQAFAAFNKNPGNKKANKALVQAMLSLADVNASLEVPKALLDVFGATKTWEARGKDYLSSDDKSFKFELVNDKGGLKINGKPHPLKQGRR